MKQEFLIHPSLTRPRVRISKQNVCFPSVTSVPGTLDESVSLPSGITFTNSEIQIQTESKCIEMARTPDGMNLILNKGTSNSTFVTSGLISSNLIKICIKCASDSLEIVDFLTSKIGANGRQNFKNIYPENLFNSNDILQINAIPFGGDFHVSCMEKSAVLPTTILGTVDSNNLIENCRYYGLVSYRKYTIETVNRLGLGCIRCVNGFTGPVFNNQGYQYLLGQNGEGGFLDNCSTIITDFDSGQSLSYIGIYKI